VANVVIIASNDNTGFEYIQRFQSNAPSYNVNIFSVLTYDPTSNTSMKIALENLVASGVKTVFVQTVDSFKEIFTIAYNMNLLNGDYWFLTTSGFNIRDLIYDFTLSAVKSWTGIWQVERQTPYDLNLSGSNPLASDWNKWYRDLYGFNTNDIPGTIQGYNPDSISLTPITKKIPNGCQNTRQLNLTRSFPDIVFNLVSI
jgi:hypothetical protein